MRPRHLSVWLCRLLVCTAAAVGQVPDREVPDPTGLDPRWTTERLSWTSRPVAGRGAGAPGLRVINEFGDVRIRPTDEDRVDIGAVVQRREDVEADARLEGVEASTQVLVEVRFPDTAIDRRLLAPGRPPDRRVDLVVSVPAGMRLEVRTVRGLIEVQGLTANAELSSETGDITAITTASLDASTERGSIAVAFRASDWSRPPRLETLTGDIRVELPRGTNAVGHLSTRYEITTDYSIEIERDGLLKTGRARIGSGGTDLFLSSHKGALKLLESVE